LILVDDGYGIPEAEGGLRYSDGYFYAKDAYGVFNARINVQPHVISHMVDGGDTFYVFSQNSPSVDEDINDGYEIGWRWIDTIDGYEFVLVDNTAGAAIWRNTTIGAAGSGITVEEHKILRHLIHFIDEGPAGGFASGAFKEVLPAADPFPTQIIWWESSSKLQKIVEKIITRNANQTPATVQWKMYDTSGVTVLVTVTDTISYSGIFELSRTRSIV
jgi:hypothetical protein